MVTIKEDCCGTPCCSWKEKLEQAFARATISINKITDQQGSVYYPDGTGNVQIPIPTSAQIAGIGEMTSKVAALEQGLNTVNGDVSDLKNGLQATDTDIDGLNASVDSVKADIKTLSDNEVAQNNRIATNESDITGIKECLISDVSILDGATTGNIKIRIDRRSAASIDSDDYNIGRPVSAEIIQGTGPSMFKIQVTLSSGQVITSNDFVFTTEAIGTDIYISSFTFKAGTKAGYISADIGLNNGVTIQANDFLIPTDPNVTTNISDLQTRMTTAESDIVNNMTEISNLKTSKVSADQGTENAGKVLGINTLGQVEPVEGGSGEAGEVWEDIDLNNWPTDWVEGDIFEVAMFNSSVAANVSQSWTSAFTNVNSLGISQSKSRYLKFKLANFGQTVNANFNLQTSDSFIFAENIATLLNVSNFNKIGNNPYMFIITRKLYNGSYMHAYENEVIYFSDLSKVSSIRRLKRN